MKLGSFLPPRGRWTELAGARLVVVLLAAGWMGHGHGHGLPWDHTSHWDSSPACREVVAGAHPQAAALGTTGGCPELASEGGHPHPHGTQPPSPVWGVVNTAEHSSSKFSPKQPWECESVGRGLQLCPRKRSPRPAVLGQGSWPPRLAVPGLLLAQAGGSRQVQGQASGTRTLLRINFFTKGKPNTFPTVN